MVAIGAGGIISAALGKIEDRNNKIMDRLHDGIKAQMQLTANQGSLTGDAMSSQEPKEGKKDKASNPTAVSAPDDDAEDEKGIADMGIIRLAKGAKEV